MNYEIKDVSARLKATREYLDISTDDMAEKVKIPIKEYIILESGEKDLSLSFLNDCAGALGVELIELLTGTEPRLQKYSIVKSGKGLPIDRRIGFTYQHMAYLFKHKKIEPLIVTAPYSEAEQDKPVHLSKHDGQEMNFIIKGKMRFTIGGNTEILEEGDCVYFDSNVPHGMVAADGKDCEFLAVLI
ncbi:MAG: cupin domain-containing protein [Oscillospiraceae bacterium]|jgi:mannose-6-phosphate isomerase-like protein (cupin superfamily)|nr:cupin domain-containing protein [Oscillospiraceae bacterium]